MRIQSSQMCQAILARNLCHTMNLNIWRVIKNYILPTFFLKSTCDFLVTPQIWHAPTSRGHIFVYFGLLYTVRICGQRIQLLACPFFFSHAGVDYLFMLYTIIIIIHRHATAGGLLHTILGFIDFPKFTKVCVLRNEGNLQEMRC